MSLDFDCKSGPIKIVPLVTWAEWIIAVPRAVTRPGPADTPSSMIMERGFPVPLDRPDDSTGLQNVLWATGDPALGQQSPRSQNASG